MTGVRIRPATAADVTAIAHIWSEGWADGHQGHVPDALAAERAPASFHPRATERIDSTWVADVGGAVAGFVVVVDVEVEQIYVDRSWRGRGVAERLLRHAESEIGKGGRRTAWLAQTATGTVPVPARRYEREVGDG